MIIAIGGVSTAGKTTLANKLRDYFSHKKTSLLCQDDFVFPIEKIPKIHDRIDWEHPASIDHQKLLKTLLAEKQQNEIVIIEGLMIYWNVEIQKYFDKCIYIEINKETFLKRKAKDNRWGGEPEWYIEHIWNSFKKYGFAPKNPKLFVIKGDQAVSMDKVIHHLAYEPAMHH